MEVGILALQGSFAEHGSVLASLNQPFIWAKSSDDIEGLTHLIIPGGESTTLRKLLNAYGIWDTILKKTKAGTLKIFGTCAGSILLQDLGMDIEIHRNAYGAQQESFEAVLDSDVFREMKGVFIRAPKIAKCGKDVEVLATYLKSPVLVRQGDFLASTFHPEINKKTEVHSFFLKM